VGAVVVIVVAVVLKAVVLVIHASSVSMICASGISSCL